MATVTAFARNGSTSPLGKNDVEIKTTVPEVLANALAEYASLSGLPKAEALRGILEASLMGALSHLPKHLVGRNLTHEQSVRALAALLGLDTKEYERHVLEEHIGGRLHVARMLANEEEGQTENAGGIGASDETARSPCAALGVCVSGG